MFDSVVRGIAMNGVANDPPKDGDYIDDDGLLVCGKCNGRKRKRIDLAGTECVVAIHCKCEMEKREREAAEKKAKEDFDKAMELKRGSLIDDKFKDASFDTCSVVESNQRQIRLCRRYAEKFDDMYKNNQGLLLHGDVGTGKSHMAACIGNYVMLHLHSVYATSFVKLLEGKQTVDIESIVRKMDRVQLVLFDDLGAERKTDYALEVVYNLIDSRYRQRKPMIITTNLTLDEIGSNADVRYSRIYDRIIECCYPVLFEGRSFRRDEGNRRFKEMKKLLED